MIRVLLGQRDALICGALAAVLSAQPDLQVVAELVNGDQVPATAAGRRAEVAVLDARLPGTTTVGELCRTLHRQLPSCRPLVVLGWHTGAALARSLLPLVPWLGLTATDTAPAALVAGVRQLAAGGRVLDHRLATAARTAREDPLTQRERDILRMTRYGAAPKEIATKLGLSAGTVRNHLAHSLAKTGARTRLAATQIAQDAGWI